MRRLLIVLTVLAAALAFAAVASAAEATLEKPVTIQATETVQAVQADYKAMYFAILQRCLELEAQLAEKDKTIMEAIELARGYRSDWEAQRAIAEARKEQATQALDLGKVLLDVIRDMKDTINKQHEIIMRLTAPKSGLQVLGGLVLKPKDLTDSGVLLGLGWQF